MEQKRKTDPLLSFTKANRLQLCYLGQNIFEFQMKNHLYQISLCVHSIHIHVSFPCAVGASLLIDNQEWEITDDIDIKQAQLSINASTQAETTLLFNPRTSAYSMKKAAINFFLKTKSGKLQAGSTTIFLNKSLQGCTKETAQISKCSDRQATVMYTMNMELLEETQTNMTASQFKGSQTSEGTGNLLKSSSVTYTRRFLNENVKLYESIVQQVDDKGETGWQKDKGSPDNAWQKNSTGSKGSSINKSLIGDLKHTSSNKGMQGWRTANDFRKSRFQTSSVGQNKKSTILINSSHYQNKLSASKAHMSQEMQDTKIVLQKKVAELQKQNKQLKDAMNGVKQRYEELLFKEKASSKKSQIVEMSLKEELEMMKQKFGSLEKEANKMLFEKNQILNKYTAKESESIAHIKAKEKTLLIENKKLSDKVERLEKQLLEQEDKSKTLETKLRQHEAQWSKKIKQYEFYQQQAMQLDEKVSELRHVEERLNNEIELLREEMERREEEHERGFEKFKKEYSSIKEVKEEETKGLSKEMIGLRVSLKEKEGELSSLKRECESEKRKLNTHISSLQMDREKLEKEVKRVSQEKEAEERAGWKSQQSVKVLEQKLRNAEMQMQNMIENRDECLGELEARLEELNVQEFRLNEQNFELEQKLALIEKSLIAKDNIMAQLQKEINLLKHNIDQRDQEISRLLQQIDSLEEVKEGSSTQVSVLKNDIIKKQAQLKDMDKKLTQLKSDYVELEKHNHEISCEFQEKSVQDQDEIITVNQKLTELTAQLDTTNLQLQTTLAQLQTTQKQMSKCANELNTLRRQHMKLKSEHESLQQQLQEEESTIINSNATITQLQQQIQQLKTEIHELQQNSSDHHSYSSAIDECMEVFEEMFSSILTKDYQIVISPKKPTAKFSTINNSNKTQNQPWANTKTDMRKLTKANIPLAQTLAHKLELLESFLVTTTQKQLESKKQTNQLTAQLESVKSLSQNQSLSISQLQSHIDQLQAELQELHSQLSQSTESTLKTTKEVTAHTNKIKQHQTTIERYKGIMDELRKQIANKNKELSNLKSTLTKTEQHLKETQQIYRQSKDKMELEVNLHANQLKLQLIQAEKLINIEKEQSRRKQTKISQLESFVEEQKTLNTKNQNQTKKQTIELKKQLTQSRKQTEKKTFEITRITNQLADLNKRIQTLNTTNKQHLQKYQKLNLELISKNKQFNESQNLIKDKTQQLTKAQARLKQLEQQLIKLKKQREDASKSLLAQQQINSKNLMTIKQQKQLIREQKQVVQKKEELLRDSQKQIKQLEGQLFNQKRLKTQPFTSEESDCSLTNSTYSYKKAESKKDDNFSPAVSSFSYNPSSSNYYKKAQQTPTGEHDKQHQLDIKELKEQLALKEKSITELQEKLTTSSKPSSNKQIPYYAFTKTASTVLESNTFSLKDQIMKQQILENLTAIQSLLSSPESGTRIDKYRMELSALLNKNKKIILEASPFEQMRKINVLILKAKTLIQNKLKIDPEPKTILIEEFDKIQLIVDQVMGK